jgi:hypothetical protein
MGQDRMKGRKGACVYVCMRARAYECVREIEIQILIRSQRKYPGNRCVYRRIVTVGPVMSPAIKPWTIRRIGN